MGTHPAAVRLSHHLDTKIRNQGRKLSRSTSLRFKLLKLAEFRIAEGTNAFIIYMFLWSQSHSSPQDMPISLWVGMIHMSFKQKEDRTCRQITLGQTLKQSHVPRRRVFASPDENKTGMIVEGAWNDGIVWEIYRFFLDLYSHLAWLSQHKSSKENSLIRSSTHVLNTPNVGILS